MDRLVPDRPAVKASTCFRFQYGWPLAVFRSGSKQGFVVTGSGIPDELGATEIDRLLAGKVMWRGGKV
jgi:hypothetical protein